MFSSKDNPILLFLLISALFLPICFTESSVSGPIDRNSLVTRYTPTRNASNPNTPMQIGNGNFAFGADVTGLQTFLPFAIMSSWGWKNDSLPPNRTIEDVYNYQGESWFNHGRLVQYDFGGDPEIEQWLIANPNRVDLGSVGLVFLDVDDGSVRNVTEADLSNVEQKLDIWTGVMSSTFSFDEIPINVTTTCAQDTSAVSITIDSALLSPNSNSTTRLGIFLDFPWNDGSQKFSAPFVGNYSPALFANHTTTLLPDTSAGGGIQAQISHQMVEAIFYTSVGSHTKINITRDSPIAHRYTILPQTDDAITSLSLVVSYSNSSQTHIPKSADVVQSSVEAWEEYWTTGGFIDLLTGSTDSRADELQRRIILSRYLMRVNDAEDNPPQESGLVNDGWNTSGTPPTGPCGTTGTYSDAQPASTIDSSKPPLSALKSKQGWPSGARWPKMTDPSGRSSPGDINNLLIWEQPHPNGIRHLRIPSLPRTRGTAEMGQCHSGDGELDVHRMYVVAEDTSPNVTVNPAFELAYWRFGLELAERWMDMLGEDVPGNWTTVKNNLAPLPIENGTYAVYEGIETDFWTDPHTPGLNLTIAKLTAEKVWVTWNVSNCWGWDFPMLAMSAARNNDTEKAIEWLLDPLFQFDDVGMPIGGVRVTTPYFPASGALLYATAMMAQGWDGSTGVAPGFPESGWNVRVEGMSTAL
ncbi:hypothetical protein BT96DRAFT_933391 [Gymnopus androsaceus JB14]|uniref:Six-hairpin glycosidase n=1 Tax=Gymnopus androsaceus JB14 TaxID=1447944 RepID=A0A6A4IBG0_9AGAR|nr:hypothetical protein BT96DRAFT_933391 [Gymnopus androsaceus JB14]